MSKIYSTPFGYRIEHGKVVVNLEESIVVKHIFDWGTQGHSLSTISSMLSRSFPNNQFNKNKVSRILKDERYIGNDIFDQIVDKESFSNANRIQMNMSTNGTEKAEILKITVPIICPDCQSTLKRFHDIRRKCPDRWVCTDKCCSYQIRFSDDDFLSEIQEIVSGLRTSDMETESDTVRRNFGTAKLEADINSELKMRTAETEKIQADILKLALMKYDDITDLGHTRTALQESMKQYATSEDYISFLNQAASKIRIEKEKTLTVVLKDGSKHRRIVENDDSTVRQGEESNENCSNAGVS